MFKKSFRPRAFQRRLSIFYRNRTGNNGLKGSSPQKLASTLAIVPEIKKKTRNGLEFPNILYMPSKERAPYFPLTLWKTWIFSKRIYTKDVLNSM